MMNLHKLQLEIRHADWPYILQGFISFFVLSFAGYLILGNGYFHYFLLVISLLFIILTIVHYQNIREEAMQHLQYKIQALNELTKLLPIRAPLPAMTGWAATPELALTVYKIIREEKPDVIAETGSGVTTVISAYSLELFNPKGRIFSFDNNTEFAERTNYELHQHKLENFVDIQVAPLRKKKIHNKSRLWYDIDFSQIKTPVDMLVIDGPPLKTQKNARYPALPVFYSMLSERAVIILHDTNRDTEMGTVSKWLSEFPDLKATILKTEKGITILRRQSPG